MSEIYQVFNPQNKCYVKKTGNRILANSKTPFKDVEFRGDPPPGESVNISHDEDKPVNYQPNEEPNKEADSSPKKENHSPGGFGFFGL